MGCRHEVLRALLRVKLKHAEVRVPEYVRMESECSECRAVLSTLRTVYERTNGGALSALMVAQKHARRVLAERRCVARSAGQESLFEEYPYPEEDSGDWGEREWGWYQATLNALAALGECASVYALRRELERRRVIDFEEGLEYESFVQGLDGISGLCVREGKVWRVQVGRLE